MESLEYSLELLGLGSPFGRFVAGFTLVNGILLWTKPRFAFDSDGNARHWSVTTNHPSSTNTPWWIPGTVAGVVLATFV